MTCTLGVPVRIFVGVICLFSCAIAQAGAMDTNMAWPLCGRITEAAPGGWVDTDGCPADRFGNAAHSDEPLSSTFGPRPLASESNRYDFHRGVDIATPISTPFFAVTDGVVEIAGNHSSYSDPLVKLRHFRPGDTDCSPDGCYHSYYLHISSWVVAEDDTVIKGQLLGYTGASGSGFEHVHFEMRDAPASDIFSAWSRDAVHPLSAVPYSAPNNTSITFNLVDFTNPSAGRADLTINSNRFDLVAVDLALFDAGHNPIAQPGDTPDANGYLVAPSSWDMEAWNFMYSHKDSTNFPWSSYGSGGVSECPYHADHGGSYSAHVHLDQQEPGQALEGNFNGLHIRTQKYWPSNVDDYTVDLDFQALTGPAACIEATAYFASGDIGYAEWGSCAPASSASLTRGPYLQMQTDDGIIVRWRTDLATDSVVRYGATPGNLDQIVTVAGSRTEHEVQLTGLGADTSWYYSVGETAGTVAGDSSYHFSTAPTQGLPADSRFWILGDSGTANANARSVRDAYKAWAAGDPADMVLMLGDNAYNDGTDAEYQAAVFDTYPEVLRQLPLFSTLGNHDGHTADSATQSGPYYDIFNLPANAEIGGLLSGTEAYYSFDYANVHFVCLDSYETDRSPGGAMMTWLQNDLALNTQPWVIAFWHHPPYTKGSHDSDTEGRLIDMRQNALPLLEDWGVDLTLSGHSHSYERSYLIDGHYGSSLTLDPVANVLDPGDGREGSDGAYEKPDSIAAARAGAVYAVAGSSGKISSAAVDHPAMFVNLIELGSMVLDVSGNRLDATFLDDAGVVRDTFTIVKTPDFDPPLITGATAVDATHVVVDFNEALAIVEAEIAANYIIGGLTVSTASLQPGDRSVRLTTSTMTNGASYALTVNNVQDVALNTIAANSQANFDFFETMTLAFQDGISPGSGYAGTRDAYIREATATTNYGSATSLQVDGSEPSGSETDMNIVVAWDISDIPADVTVESAFMQLQVTNTSSGSYGCYELLGGWDEATVTWNQAASGDAWASTGASGADRGNNVCTVNAGTTGTLTVPFGAAGLAMIQGWVSNPASNYGLLIADPNTSDGADFRSSDSATTIERPRLEVTYQVPTTPPPNEVDYTAVADLPSAGSLSGTFTATHTDNGSSQSILERDSGGKKNNRYSYLSHTWQFSTGTAMSLSVIANAWSGGSSEGDSFLFEVSTNNSSFTPLFTVSSTSSSNVQSAGISGSGTFYIRVTDTDQTPGNRSRDTVFIDQLIIRGNNTVPTDPPAAPTTLQVTGGTSSTLTLAWQHPDTDEESFDVQRSLASSGAWANLPSVGGGSTGLTDTGLDDDTAYDYRIRARNAAGVSAWSNTATGATDVAPAIALSANGYKIKGKHTVDLDWSGAGSANVDIERDGGVVDTVPNSGVHTDAMSSKGGATFRYRVCEADTSTCSNEVVVSF